MLARLFLFGALLLLDEPIDVRFQGLERLDAGRITVILDDAAARAGCEIQERHIDETLEVARGPGRVFQAGQGR